MDAAKAEIRLEKSTFAIMASKIRAFNSIIERIGVFESVKFLGI